MQGWSLAIDFGTTNTVAVLQDPSGRRVALFFDDSELLPSGVFVDQEQNVLTGRDALRTARIDPARFEPHPKRCMYDAEIAFGQTGMETAAIIAAIFMRVMAEARRVATGPIASVILTHPEAWAGPRQEKLLAAARLAGIHAPRLVPEPVAAAYFLLDGEQSHLQVGQFGLVYDFGGGTLDVAVVQRVACGIRVCASGGLPDVGGNDIDAAVARHFRAAYPNANWGWFTAPQSVDDLRHARQLWDDIAGAKASLSRLAMTHVVIPGIDSSAALGREALDDCARPIVKQTLAVVGAVLQQAGVQRQDLAVVALVGGASRLPLVATMVHTYLGIACTIGERPETVVAEGALLAPDQSLPAPDPLAAQPSTAGEAQPPASWPGPESSPSQPPPASSQRRQGRRIFVVALTAILLLGVGAVAWEIWKPRGSNGLRQGNGAPPKVINIIDPDRLMNIKKVAFSPDGTLVAGVDGNGGMHVFSSLTGQKRWESTNPTLLDSVFFTHDSAQVVVSSSAGIRIFDARTGKEGPRPFTGMTRYAAECQGLLAVAGDTSVTFLRQAATGWQTAGNLANVNSTIQKVVCNNTRLVVVEYGPFKQESGGYGPAKSTVWELNTQKIISDGVSEPNEIFDVAISGSGLYVATRSSQLKRWADGASLQQTVEFLGGISATCLAMDPTSGKMLAVCLYHRVEFRDPNNIGQSVHEQLEMGNDSPSDVAFSGDGRRIVVGSSTVPQVMMQIITL